jgi:hypothetical protein
MLLFLTFSLTIDKCAEKVIDVCSPLSTGSGCKYTYIHTCVKHEGDDRWEQSMRMLMILLLFLFISFIFMIAFSEVRIEFNFEKLYAEIVERQNGRVTIERMTTCHHFDLYDHWNFVLKSCQKKYSHSIYEGWELNLSLSLSL